MAAGIYTPGEYDPYGGYFIKLDSLGDTIFTRTYLGDSATMFMSIYSIWYDSRNNMFYATGYNYYATADLFLMKLDSLGNTNG